MPLMLLMSPARRGRCALNKCYKRAGLGSALSYGTRKLTSKDYLAFRPRLLASWGSFQQFLVLFAPEVSGGSRMDIYGTIRDSNIAPRQGREQHRAVSADTKIGFVRYDYERDVRFRNDFFGNP